MYDGLMIYGPELWIIIDLIILGVVWAGAFFVWGYFAGRGDRLKTDRQRREK